MAGGVLPSTTLGQPLFESLAARNGSTCLRGPLEQAQKTKDRASDATPNARSRLREPIDYCAELSVGVVAATARTRKNRQSSAGSGNWATYRPGAVSTIVASRATQFTRSEVVSTK